MQKSTADDLLLNNLFSNPCYNKQKKNTQKIQEIKKALTTKRKGSRMASGGYKMDVENLYASGSFVKVNRAHLRTKNCFRY